MKDGDVDVVVLSCVMVIIGLVYAINISKIIKSKRMCVFVLNFYRYFLHTCTTARLMLKAFSASQPLGGVEIL